MPIFKSGVTVEIPAVPQRIQQLSGVSHYQNELKRVKQGPVWVELQAEPKNKHDPNAVLALIGGKKVGYLSSKMAPDYQPLVRALQREGRVGTQCEAEPWEGGMGIVLHLPRADRLAEWVNTNPAYRHQARIRAHRFRLKRANDYKSNIEALVGARKRTEAEVSAQPYTMERGKYSGHMGLSFWLDSMPIGLMDPKAREQAETVFQWVEHGINFTLPAVIEATGNGYTVEVEYYLPLQGWQPSTPPPPPVTG